MKKIFLLIIVSILFFACSTQEQDIEDFLIDKTNTVIYNIQGQVSNISAKHFVSITKPLKLNNELSFEGITDATVSVSDGTNTFTFSLVPTGDAFYDELKLKSGVYRSNQYFRGVPEKSYTLTVTIGGKTFTATDLMPEPQNSTENELQILNRSRAADHWGQEFTSIWSDRRKNRDAYGTIVSSDLNFYNRLRPETTFISEQPLNPFVDKSSNSERMFRYTISSGYEQFIWGLLSQTRWNADNVISTEPGKLASNFNNPEVAGYFSAISSVTYKRNTPQAISSTVYDTEKVFSTTYDQQGLFSVRFKPTGECILEGLGTSVLGAYELEENESGNIVGIHFPNTFITEHPQLFKFYTQSIAINPFLTFTTNDSMAFRIVNNTLVSKNDVVWNE